MSDKVKVTIEYQGQTHNFEGYSLIGAMVTLPKDAPVQAITNISFGRLSAGDHLSAMVAAITSAEKELYDLPQPVREQLLNHAIREGLQGGLK
jgi:hypothetical protein